MNIKINKLTNEFVLSILLILSGGIFFIIGSTGCDDNSNFSMSQEGNDNYLEVYPFFSEQLKKMDRSYLSETNIKMFIFWMYFFFFFIFLSW